MHTAYVNALKKVRPGFRPGFSDNTDGDRVAVVEQITRDNFSRAVAADASGNATRSFRATLYERALLFGNSCRASLGDKGSSWEKRGTGSVTLAGATDDTADETQICIKCEKTAATLLRCDLFYTSEATPMECTWKKFRKTPHCPSITWKEPARECECAVSFESPEDCSRFLKMLKPPTNKEEEAERRMKAEARRLS